MREIQASDAKARLPQLLDDVERGETTPSPGTAGRSPGSCPRRIAARKKSTKLCRASVKCASGPENSASSKSPRRETKDASTDAVRPGCIVAACWSRRPETGADPQTVGLRCVLFGISGGGHDLAEVLVRESGRLGGHLLVREDTSGWAVSTNRRIAPGENHWSLDTPTLRRGSFSLISWADAILKNFEILNHGKARL